MLATLILAAALVGDPPSTPHQHRRTPATRALAEPPPYSEKGFGGMPHRLTPAERKLVNSPWDVNRTRFAKHNRHARMYKELRLRPNEAVWFMRTHMNLYRQ
jgi:hypothetical protein